VPTGIVSKPTFRFEESKCTQHFSFHARRRDSIKETENSEVNIEAGTTLAVCATKGVFIVMTT
jgi:hypothetical protein